jgi:hypothetical protein
MSKINVRNFSNENEDGAPDLVGITTFSATSYFVPTRGNTKERPSGHVEVGSLRYNYDTKNLEYYKGDLLGWSQFELIDPDLGGGTGSNTGLGTRALFGGGHSPGYVDTIDFITISTLGDAQDFGDFAGTDRGFGGGASSRTRALFMGGYTGSAQNDIDFNIFASLGNSTDFGNLVASNSRPKGTAADQVRALFAGGDQVPGTRNVATIDYVTMAQEGNAVDFGDLVTATRSGTSSTMGSSTRGIFAGGNTPTNIDTIEFVTIQTTGDATDFGDLTAATVNMGAFSNSTRGLVGGGQSPSNTNKIEFITIASKGNATDFGDRTVSVEQVTGASSPTRGVFAGGNPFTNVIDFVEILTTGNATNFGDLTDARRGAAGASNGHGGL